MIQLSLTSHERSLRDLSMLTEQVIVKRLQNVSGVGQIRVNGEQARQVLVQIRPDQLKSLGVGVDEVMNAITTTNANLPAGRITRGVRENLVRIEGKMKEAADFKRIIVANRASGPVYLSQVADITDGAAEEQSISRVNGERAISLEIAKIQDANTVDVGNGVKAAIEAMKASLPKDIQFRILDDKAKTVQGQLDNVKDTILEGAVLTMVIVFLFLHSWRSTVITGLTLPISVLASFIAMKYFGFTLNFLTLMALSLCIGLLIDDAIVVRENIVRHLGMGKDHVRAAEDGTGEIGLAVMATTFAIVAVFVPIAFMQGIIGRFFLQFGITVAVAVLVSLFVSFTLDPMLSSVWPDPVAGRFKYLPWLGRLMERIEHGIERLHGVYARVLGLALALAQADPAGRARAVRRQPGPGADDRRRIRAADRRRLHPAALQDPGRLQPRLLRRQAAPGRGGPGRLQGNRQRLDRDRFLGRPQLFAGEPEADGRAQDPPPLAAGDGKSHPRAPVGHRRRPADRGRPADLHRHPRHRRGQAGQGRAHA